jgi:hypothetical protein
MASPARLAGQCGLPRAQLGSAAFDDIAQADGGEGIRHLDANHRLAGHGRLDANAGRSKREGEVVRQGGDALHFDTRSGNDLPTIDGVAIAIDLVVAIDIALADVACADIPARLHAELGHDRSWVDLDHLGVDVVRAERFLDHARSLVQVNRADLHRRDSLQ